MPKFDIPTLFFTVKSEIKFLLQILQYMPSDWTCKIMSFSIGEDITFEEQRWKRKCLNSAGSTGIYIFVEKESGEILYVGKTSDSFQKRVGQHFSGNVNVSRIKRYFYEKKYPSNKKIFDEKGNDNKNCSYQDKAQFNSEYSNFLSKYRVLCLCIDFLGSHEQFLFLLEEKIRQFLKPIIFA